jgi:hypothetical protein
MAKEIVMSLPALCRADAGGLFTLYPTMGAVRAVGKEEKMYIASVLNKVANEIPVARLLAEFITEFGLEEPAFTNCDVPAHERIYGEDAGATGDIMDLIEGFD